MTATAVSVRERPLLVSAEMVRAILDGRKTQTRRVVRNQSRALHLGMETPEFRASVIRRCPYGQPGDRLWVRETWIIGHDDGNGGWSVLRPTGHSNREGRVFYRASFDEPDPNKGGRMLWRPSIHMPRWASRITLEVTGVRVERLQELSELDAVAEGLDPVHPGEHKWQTTPFARTRYAELWDSLNEKRGYGWETNPWIWVIEFRRLESA